MKKITLLLLFMIAFVGCKKEEVLVPNFIDGVPDARFAGTWYQGGNKNDYYSFSTDNNLITRFNLTGGSIMNYLMYWRKAKNGLGFEYKLKGDLDMKSISYSKEDEKWDKFNIEIIDDKNIKIGNTIYSK